MPLYSIIVDQISGRTHEDTGHMDQFAKRKINNQAHDQEEMYIKHDTDSVRHYRVEAQKSRAQFFDSDRRLVGEDSPITHSIGYD